MLHSRDERSVLAARCLDSHIGPLLIVVTDVGVAHIAFQEAATDSPVEQLVRTFGALGQDALAESSQLLDDTVGEIVAWLNGELTSFTVPIDWCLTSENYRGEVQRALCTIPRGEAWSYRELAEATGRPRAARAVGSACATNPLPLIVPCHRVIRSDGTIGPYGVQLGLARGSEIKRQLLAMEGVEFGWPPASGLRAREVNRL